MKNISVFFTIFLQDKKTILEAFYYSQEPYNSHLQNIYLYAYEGLSWHHRLFISF